MSSEPELAVAAQPTLKERIIGWYRRKTYRWKAEDSNLMRHAHFELDRYLGVDDEHDFYGGMTKKAVLELMETFARQGHSGMSASIVLDIFDNLAQFKALTALTDNPDEWNHVGSAGGVREKDVWQNRRQSEAFSNDGGKTYYLLSERRGKDIPIWHTSRDHRLPIFDR